MRLWRRTMPPRFHMSVVMQLKQHKTVEWIYNHLINSRVVNLDRHKKTKEEVMGYI